MITAERIKRFAPSARADLVQAIVDNWGAAASAGITTPRRVQQFFANIATETGGVRSVEESLTYTSAARLRQVWPTRFKSDAAAAPYVRQPKKLAIYVYGGRMGNAPAPSSDGWDFRGGGMLQTTGREGYRKMGFEANPEALREPVTAFLTAVREWKARGCNALADKGDTVGVRRKINGGTNGLDETRKWLAKAEKVFTGDFDAKGAPAPAKPAPSALAPAMTEYEVRALQQQLQDALYTEVGMVDGKWGTRTEAGLFAFQRDNGLPATGKMDAETRAFIVKNGVPKRKIAAARAEATAESLAKEGNLPAAAKEAQKSAFWSRLQLVGGSVTAILYGARDYIGDALSAIAPLRDDLSAVGPWLVIAAVIGVAAVMYLRSKGAVDAAVLAVRKGQDTGV